MPVTRKHCCSFSFSFYASCVYFLPLCFVSREPKKGIFLHSSFVHKICPVWNDKRYTYSCNKHLYKNGFNKRHFCQTENKLVFSSKAKVHGVKCFCAFLFIGSVDDAWTFADELQEQIYSNDANVEQNMNRDSQRISEKTNSDKTSTRCEPSPQKEILKKVATTPPPPPKRTMSTGTSPPPQSISTQVKRISHSS